MQPASERASEQTIDRVSQSPPRCSSVGFCSYIEFFFGGGVLIGSLQASSTIFNRSSGAVSYKSLCNGTFPMLREDFFFGCNLAFEVKDLRMSLDITEGREWEVRKNAKDLLL